ncbi:MAG: tetratricopeptide repeat protein [Candidatus Wallbacteria bacterium]|nr:tetratricopeptide repeat protein [Candidatus Wallbacteria bacterium]
MQWLDKQLKTYSDDKHEGDRLLEEGQFEDAHMKLQEAMEALDRLYRREHDETLNLLQKCWKELVTKNVELGDQFLQEENYAMAREHYQTALDLAQSREEKDEIRIKLGQTGPERATTNLSNLFEEVERNPASPEAIYNFATELGLEGHFPQAVTYFEKLVELTPEDCDAQLMLANTLADCERFEDAERAYGKAREKGATDAEVDYRLGDLQYNRGDHAAAVRYLARALENQPDHADAQRALAHIFAVGGEYDRAIAAYGGVLKLDAEDSEAYFELGNCYEIRGQMEKARESWMKATEVDPDSDFAAFARDKLESTEPEGQAD